MEQAISFLTESDKVMAMIVAKYGVPVVTPRPEGFETLCKLILEQQVSIESARACFTKLESLLGNVDPQNVLSLTDECFKQCGISRQKTNYLKNLALAITEKKINLEALSLMSSEEVRSVLIPLKGIGNWTVDVYLLFALQKPDIMPLGDIAVINTIKELYECTTKEDIEQLSQQWKPYRSMATFFLWHYYLTKRNRKPFF